jgi:hypothetical protein
VVGLRKDATGEAVDVLTVVRVDNCFGRHAAMFGVNPWTLMTWMGHKRIDEAMLYVHVAANHRRDIPPGVIAAGAAEADPDRRIVAMLGCTAGGGGEKSR